MPLEPPAVDATFSSIESAFRTLQRHARSQGYALVKVRPSNYDSNGIPRRYDLACACGNRNYSSSSTGLRKCQTRKTGCPFKMKVVQKKLFGDVWVPSITCGEHNHGPEDPAKFPEHRLGSLRRRHFEKIKTLSRDSGMNHRSIREALQAEEPGLLITDSDIGNILRELKSAEQEGDNNSSNEQTPASRRRHRRFMNDDDEEEEEGFPEPQPADPAASQPMSEEESELHKTLLALVPKIVRETIAAMPMAMPSHVAAVAAAATARLRDVAIQQQHPQQPLANPHLPPSQHPQQPAPSHPQQLQLSAGHRPDMPPPPTPPPPPPGYHIIMPPSTGPTPPHSGFGVLVPYARRHQ